MSIYCEVPDCERLSVTTIRVAGTELDICGKCAKQLAWTPSTACRRRA